MDIEIPGLDQRELPPICSEGKNWGFKPWRCVVYPMFRTRPTSVYSHLLPPLHLSIFCAKRDASSGHEVPEIGLGFLAAELVPRGDISYQLQTSGWSWWYALGRSMDFPYLIILIYHDTGGFVSSCTWEFQKWFNENIWRPFLRSQLFDDVGEFLKAVLVLATSHPSQQGTPVATRHPSDDPTSVRHLHLLGVSPGDHQKGILLENHHLSQHPIAAETTKEQLAKAADVSKSLSKSLLVCAEMGILSQKRHTSGILWTNLSTQIQTWMVESSWIPASSAINCWHMKFTWSLKKWEIPRTSHGYQLKHGQIMERNGNFPHFIRRG